MLYGALPVGESAGGRMLRLRGASVDRYRTHAIVARCELGFLFPFDNFGALGYALEYAADPLVGVFPIELQSSHAGFE